jgi:predicted lipoprotein with Yx(FWY)xxD motif
MHFRTVRSATVGLGNVALGTALLVAACSSGQTTATSPPQQPPHTTVAVRSVDGTTTLVDTAGKVLYTNDQDRPGHPMCTTSGCTAIWAPLTVKGAQPTAASAVPGTVGSVALPDGERQATWNGRPLYTFSLDAPGQASGAGVRDSFGGTDFVWRAAVTKGHAPAQSSGSSDGSGYSY